MRNTPADSANGPATAGAIVSGVVINGDHRGRTLGFPTANLDPDPDSFMPGDGVYAGKVVRADGTVYVAAISIGRRPTYYRDGTSSLLEAHLLDFDADLYGEHIDVEVGPLVRGQRAFASSEELTAQIHADVDAVPAQNEG